MSLSVRFAIVLVCSSCLGILNACSSSPQPNTPNTAASQPEKGDKKKKGDKDSDKGSDEPKAGNPNLASTNVTCDKSLWDHVYNPERLEVEKDCMAVTGTITERSTDDDGDEHMLLKLDDGQDDLLTKKNKKKKEDELVIEAVCAGTPNLKKVGDACNNFKNSVQLPQVGDHVRVIGSLVLDTHNGWAEIHPISRVEQLGR